MAEIKMSRNVGVNRSEQDRRDDEPPPEDPLQSPVRVVVLASCGPVLGRLNHSALTLPAIEKIGRYIAIRITPTMPPMNTIIKGSSSEVSAATAMSTSSS